MLSMPLTPICRLMQRSVVARAQSRGAVASGGCRGHERASTRSSRILRKSTTLAGQQAAPHLDPPDAIIPDDDPATLDGSGYSLWPFFRAAQNLPCIGSTRCRIVNLVKETAGSIVYRF